MIHLTGRLTCRDMEEAAMVRRELPEHIRLTRAEPGCLTFEVTATDDPLCWQVDETFRDHAAFEAHQTRTRASAWYAATAAIPRAFRQTETQAANRAPQRTVGRRAAPNPDLP